VARARRLVEASRDHLVAATGYRVR
jgi:hypothetical protein